MFRSPAKLPTIDQMSGARTCNMNMKEWTKTVYEV
jgi:hypothetical protein